MKKSILIIGAIVIVLAFSFSSLFVPSFGEYSDGERGGILQKFSHKGLMIKTWEGELALDGVKTQSIGKNVDVSSVFAFSVKDTSVARQISNAVKLHYIQNFHTNKFDGSTDYFIDKVEILK